METLTTIVVQESDIDELMHVNNKEYVGYLEKARGDWYAKSGFSFDEMRKHGLGTVVVKLTITYFKEAMFGEKLTIKTIPVRLGTTSFDFKQEIYNEIGDKVAEALVTNVMFDRIKRKSVPVVSKIARQFPAK